MRRYSVEMLAYEGRFDIVTLKRGSPLPGHLTRQLLLRQAARLGINGKYLFYRFRMAVRRFIHCALNNLRNVGKTNLPLKEGRHSNLVSCIKSNGLGSPGR